MIRAALKSYKYKAEILTSRFISPEPEFLDLERWVKPGDTVLDFGANVGHYTLAFSRIVGPVGHVYAWEPIASTFKLLVQNLRFAQCSNVTPLNYAAASFTGTGFMSVPNGNFYQAKRAATGLPVSFLNPSIFTYKSVNFIKIDVEGAELDVLSALDPIITLHRPALLVELNGHDFEPFCTRHRYNKISYAASPNILLIPEGYNYA